MATNTKPIGVAYEDPYLDGAVINNSTITGTVTSTAVSEIAVLGIAHTLPQLTHEQTTLGLSTS